MSTSANARRHFESLSDAAERTGLSVRTLRRRIAAGHLPAYRSGPRVLRVDPADVDRLMVRVPTVWSPEDSVSEVYSGQATESLWSVDIYVFARLCLSYPGTTLGSIRDLLEWRFKQRNADCTCALLAQIFQRDNVLKGCKGTAGTLTNNGDGQVRDWWPIRALEEFAGDTETPTESAMRGNRTDSRC